MDGFTFTRAARSTPEYKLAMRKAALERRKPKRRKGAKEQDKGISCTECGSTRLHTPNTRQYMHMQRRQKSCKNCGHSFYTLEIPESTMPDFDEISSSLETAFGILSRVQTIIKTHLEGEK
jgi:transcription elongation factor Elf1